MDTGLFKAGLCPLARAICSFSSHFTPKKKIFQVVWLEEPSAQYVSELCSKLLSMLCQG